LVGEALRALRGSLATVSQLEIAAEGVRQACHFLEELVGVVDIEGVLDEVFSRFCIGK
jgi:tRNA U34 5-carboxymethylaminomethyl modifying GTPase MnmE/TrmE